jgi:antitoxin CptB
MGDDGSESIEVRRKRLRYRSWNRGLKETDLILGRFADRHLLGFDAWHLDRYEALLEESDPDIFAWVARREPLPERHDNAVLKLLLKFKFYDQ